jgi:hypothetical protein
LLLRKYHISHRLKRGNLERKRRGSR